MATPAQAILVDTNVFVSAIKPVPRVTDSLRLIVHLLEADVRLVGNEILAEEYLRYAQLLPSPTAAALAASILGPMEIIRVEERFVRACAPYFGGKSARFRFDQSSRRDPPRHDRRRDPTVARSSEAVT